MKKRPGGTRRAYEKGRDALLAAFGPRAKLTAAEAKRLDEAWGLSGHRVTFADAYDAFMKGRDPKSFGAPPGVIEGARDRAPGRRVRL